MPPSLANVCRVHEQPVFTSAMNVTFHVSLRCCNYWNMLMSGWYQPEYCKVNSCASVPSPLLQALKVKSMLQYLSCVYSLIRQSQLSPAVHCVCWVYLTICLLSWQITLLRNVLPHLMLTCSSKNKCLRTYYGHATSRCRVYMGRTGGYYVLAHDTVTKHCSCLTNIICVLFHPLWCRYIG